MIEPDDNQATGGSGRVRRSGTPRVRRRHMCALAAAAVLLAACGSSSGDEATVLADVPADVDSTLLGPPAPDTALDVETSITVSSTPDTVDVIDITAPERAVPASTEAMETDVFADDKPLWELGKYATVPAGTTRLPMFGGIQFELDRERTVIPTLGSVVSIRIDGDPAVEVNLVMVTQTSDYELIGTAEEFIAALADHVGAEMTPIGQVTTPIGPAQGFEYSGLVYPSNREEAISQDTCLFAGPEWIWLPYPVGQMWMVDTERGPILVSVEAMETGPMLDEAVVTADRLLETLEFADLDRPRPFGPRRLNWCDDDRVAAWRRAFALWTASELPPQHRSTISEPVPLGARSGGDQLLHAL